MSVIYTYVTFRLISLSGKQLGSGAFGVVMKAEAQEICSSETVTTVAVKMVRRTTDPTYVRALASELKIMVHLGKHLNVVNLLGACTKNISKRTYRRSDSRRAIMPIFKYPFDERWEDVRMTVKFIKLFGRGAHNH